MSISTFQFGEIGAHTPVEGPYSSANFFLPSMKPGTVVAGDNGAELIFCLVDVVSTGFTSNQGDVFTWDNSHVASRAGEIAVAGEYDVGLNVGSIWFGGQTGLPTIVGQWSYTFTPGLYGCWFQRAGVSLCKVNAATNYTTAPPATIGGNAGIITFVTALTTKSNPMPIGAIGLMPMSKTFTGDLLTGSNTILNVNTGKWLQKGMRLTGTGIPTTTASKSTHITDINGATVTMSAAATASNNTVTITALQGSTSATTTSGSPLLTNIQAINGFYPNQTISGTGVPGSTTILAINTTGNTFSILMSANATATADNIAITNYSPPSTGFPNYCEGYVNWPYFSAVTSA